MDDAQLRMRNSLKMGLYINVAGMLLALVGAEQIVGTLVAKVLYSQGEEGRVQGVGGGGRKEVRGCRMTDIEMSRRLFL